MARIRTIKPEFCQSETIGKLSRDARLLFIQLWTIVDDHGRARGSSRLLAASLYPYDQDVLPLIDGWMVELESFGCVRRYILDGDTYLDIPNWSKHQRIDNAGKSRIPEFSGDLPRDAENNGDPPLYLGPSTIGPSTGAAPSAIAPSNGSLTQEAINLSDRVALLLGWQPQDIPPEWCGAAYKVQAWLSEGWAGDLIFASIEKQMTSRTGPPNTIKYFEKGIADFIAEQTAPLPKGTVNGYRGPRPFQDDSRSASRAADRLIEAAERGEFTFGPRPSLLPEGGENPIRLIPKG